MKARENPFRSEKIDTIPYVPVALSVDGITERLASMDYRGAIVGREGAGKTTLLDTLEQRFQSSGIGVLRLHVRDTGISAKGILRACDGLSVESMVFIDGTEQISERAWRSIARGLSAFRGILIASHAEGKLPTLVKCETSPELLDSLLSRIVPGAGENVREVAQSLFSEYAGNIRLVFRDLYDRADALYSRV